MKIFFFLRLKMLGFSLGVRKMERIGNESIRAHVRCLEVKPFIVFEDNIFSPSFRERVYFLCQ